MAKKQGENIHGPSYEKQNPVLYENKSIKRETRAMTGDGGSGAVRPAQVTKSQRRTGRIS